MNWKICLLAFLWPCVGVFAQTAKPKTPWARVRIGDEVPDPIWQLPLLVANHPDGKTSIKLEDYRGKLIILDFWATWCTGCIKAMPKMDSLQRKFRNDVQILPVTYEDKIKTDVFLRSNPKIKKLRLFSIFEDTLLSRLFPHRFLPHVVWIDMRGNVAAITESWQVTSNNIRKVLTGEKVPFIAKRDQLEYDRRKPLLIDNNGGIENDFLSRSLITSYMDGMPMSWYLQEDTAAKRIKLTATNMPLLDLYSIASNIPAYLLNPKRILVNKHAIPGEYLPDRTLPWHTWRDRTYCYELIVPLKDRNDVYARMMQDLNRFFKVRGRVEEKSIPVLVIQRENETQREYPQGEPLSVLISFLNQQTALPLLLDETGYKTHIKLLKKDLRREIVPSELTTDKLRKKLKPYGLNLIETHQAIKVLVVTKN